MELAQLLSLIKERGRSLSKEDYEFACDEALDKAVELEHKLMEMTGAANRLYQICKKKDERIFAAERKLAAVEGVE